MRNITQDLASISSDICTSVPRNSFHTRTTFFVYFIFILILSSVNGVTKVKLLRRRKQHSSTFAFTNPTLKILYAPWAQLFHTQRWLSGAARTARQERLSKEYQDWYSLFLVLILSTFAVPSSLSHSNTSTVKHASTLDLKKLVCKY